MKIHRFYVDPAKNIELKHQFWFHDEQLVSQWLRVLRFRPGQEIVLFDGVEHNRLYRLVELTGCEAHLEMITDYERKLPSREVYLFWSLLKKDKNDWVLQKCTELGASHFIPLLADRSEKTGFNLERAKKIIIEAVEQCGRSDIPAVREPMRIATALGGYKDNLKLLVADAEGLKIENCDLKIAQPTGVLIGPEGGWSEAEKDLFKQNKIQHLNLHKFTLRAETAAVTAVSFLTI